MISALTRALHTWTNAQSPPEKPVFTAYMLQSIVYPALDFTFFEFC
jgi:hypothetical protein